MATPDWQAPGMTDTQYKNDIDNTAADHESRIGVIESNPNQANTELGGIGAEDGADTWAKIATFSTPGGSSATNTLVGILHGDNISSSPTYEITVLLSGSGGVYNSNSEVIMRRLAGVENPLLVDGAKIVAASTTLGTDVELWVKKSVIYNSWSFKEVASSMNSITYETDSPWQSADPGSGAAFEVVSAASDFNTGVGIGQTWQNVGGSRSANVTYTNTTGKPIGISVTADGGGVGVQADLVLYINGSTIARSFADHTTNYTHVFVTGIVPPGSTYSILNPTGSNIYSWKELR